MLAIGTPYAPSSRRSIVARKVAQDPMAFGDVMDEIPSRRDEYAADESSDLMGLEASSKGDVEGFLTFVCVNCGNEYYYSGTDQPDSLVCGRCQSTVFRGYFTHEVEDDAARDFEDSTGRDLHTDDAEGDALPGDILDLNRE